MDSVHELLRSARHFERSGQILDAIEQYDRAVAVSEQGDDASLLSISLRRLGVAHHQRNECELGRALCGRSIDVARHAENHALAGEALNALGVMLLREGALGDAEQSFLRALSIGAGHDELRARAEQNLGIIANIRGDLHDARARYECSLTAYLSLDDDEGCARAYHNLGIVSRQQELYEEAERLFGLSREIAEREGDVRLQALCMLSQAEVCVMRHRFAEARANAEASLSIFDRMGARDFTSGAYRVIGVVCRETGRNTLAESRLRTAIDFAVASGSALPEAEASRELALVYEAMGRVQDALSMLHTAHRLFIRLGARLDIASVGRRMAALRDLPASMRRPLGLQTA